jgi:hypothetical protein
MPLLVAGMQLSRVASFAAKVNRYNATVASLDLVQLQ